MKKIVSLVALVALLATAIFAMAMPAAAAELAAPTAVSVVDSEGTTYNLLTGAYKDNTVTYDATTATLTLNGANLKYLSASGAAATTHGITIVVKGTNTITAKATDVDGGKRWGAILNAKITTTVKGDGVLNVTLDATDSSNYSNTGAIYASQGAFIFTDNVTVNATSDIDAVKIIGNATGVHLTVSGNAKLNATGIYGRAIKNSTGKAECECLFTIADNAVVTAKVTEGDESTVGVVCNNLKMTGGELNIDYVGADYGGGFAAGLHVAGVHENDTVELSGGKINIKVKHNNTDVENVYGILFQDVTAVNLKGTKVSIDVATPKTGEQSGAIKIMQKTKTNDVPVSMTKGSLEIKADAKTPVAFINTSETAKATVSITGGTYTSTAAANAAADATNITVTVSIPEDGGDSGKDEPSKTADASEVALAAVVAVAALGMMTAMVAKKKEF